MTVYDWSKVSRETLETLAKTTHELAVAVDDTRGCPNAEPLMLGRIDAINACRSEALVPPLRTKAEIDSDIANFIRSQHVLLDEDSRVVTIRFSPVRPFLDLFYEPWQGETVPRAPVSYREWLLKWGPGK